MKIRLWDRLILFLGGVLALLSGAFMIAQGAVLLWPAGSGTGAAAEAAAGLPVPFMLPEWLWAEIGMGAVLALLGIYLMAFPHRFAYRKHDFVIQQIENGELRIAVKAIENLVQKCVDMHPEIRMVSMHVQNARDGVTIDLRIALANNISIPLAVASLQKQIKQYLVASSGIEVKEVRVSVETAEDAAEDSPYLVSGESGAGHAPQEKPAEAPEKAKPALHRRIFGRSEQPAIVPEAPAPDSAPAAEAETAPETTMEPAGEQPQEKAADDLVKQEAAENE